MVARARRPGARGAATTRGHLKVCALNHANADKMRTRDCAASFSRLVASVATAAETVPALDHADAPLAPRSPFLPVAEPALLLHRAFARHSWWSDWECTLALPLWPWPRLRSWRSRYPQRPWAN